MAEAKVSPTVHTHKYTHTEAREITASNPLENPGKKALTEAAKNKRNVLRISCMMKKEISISL